jgi:hypothetical protein
MVSPKEPVATTGNFPLTRSTVPVLVIFNLSSGVSSYISLLRQLAKRPLAPAWKVVVRQLVQLVIVYAFITLIWRVSITGTKAFSFHQPFAFPAPEGNLAKPHMDTGTMGLKGWIIPPGILFRKLPSGHCSTNN